MKVIKKLISLFTGKSKSKGAEKGNLQKQKSAAKPVQDNLRNTQKGRAETPSNSRGGRRGADSSRVKKDFGTEPRGEYRSDSRGDSRSNNRRGGRKDGPSEARPPRQRPQSLAPKPKEVLPCPSFEELAAAVPEFAKLGLAAKLLAAVKDGGYENPTDVQKKAIPVILSGKDIVATAQTGTGKTAAFSLPIIQLMDGHPEPAKPNSPKVLVLSPTRELAAQIAEAFEGFAKFTPYKVLLVQGGVSMNPQIWALEDGVDVVVATPGRLLDLMRQRIISLKDLRYLILDEVDRMFDMGFIEDVSNIINACPPQRQTLFFSATMPEAVLRLSKWALKDPETVEVGIMHTPADTIEHFVYPVEKIQKYDLLLALLNSLNYESAIVFTRTRMDSDRICRWIEENQGSAVALHSDRSQSEREQALKSFKEGKVKNLVATDIASRGLDITNVTYVINYNVPEQPEDYVHRIGRTGRANREGTAITLYSTDETQFLSRIERFIGRPIERRALDDFAYRSDPLFEVKKTATKKRRNK